MEILKEYRSIRQEVEVFQSFDGRKFDNVDACKSHEEKKLNLKHVLNKMRIDSLEEMMPCDGAEHNEESGYRWYRVTTPEEAECINKYYDLNEREAIENKDLPDVFCIETKWDNWLYKLSEMRQYIKDFFGKMDVQVTFSDET